MNFIKNGDLVDVIFLGTACTAEEINQIKSFLNKRNLTANIFLEKDLTLSSQANHEFPSFSAQLRFEQLKKSIENPQSKIIWCARGGYGSAELLEFLYKMPKPKNKKIFIGFSDISVISTFLIQEWGWQVISAPVLLQMVLNKVSSESIEAILNLLFGEIEELKYDLRGLTPFERGQTPFLVVGGCISVLVNNFATKNQLNWEDKILFLEDEGEDGERLDRYFQQILTIIIEQQNYPAAILLGNFLEANPHGTPRAQNIEIAINRLAQKIADKNLEIPLFVEKSGVLGHSKNMMPLILGAKAEINSMLCFIVN